MRTARSLYLKRRLRILQIGALWMVVGSITTSVTTLRADERAVLLAVPLLSALLVVRFLIMLPVVRKNEAENRRRAEFEAHARRSLGGTLALRLVDVAAPIVVLSAVFGLATGLATAGYEVAGVEWAALITRNAALTALVMFVMGVILVLVAGALLLARPADGRLTMGFVVGDTISRVEHQAHRILPT
jgi:hypothetical protein